MADHWPAWRGTDGLGTVAGKLPPLKWSATENVKWKVPLPDRGNSTPIVWGSRVFVTQPLEKENRRTLMCLDRADGKLLWQSGVTYTNKEATHKTNPQCSASPVTDGERVIAFFGSAGLFAYDFNGKELWRRELGKHIHEWGNAASPVLHGDLCILNFGPGPNNFLLAVDKRTGKTVWKVETPDVHPAERTDGFKGQAKGIIGSWSTPILIKAGGRDELVMSYPNDLRAFNPKTGALLWKCDGLNPLIYTSPIFGDGVVVGMGGFYGTTVAAKTGGSGDVSATHRLWQTVRTANRLGAGVVHGEHIYILNTSGIAECLELKTGKTVWEERLPGIGPKKESWSSLVRAGDRLYILNQSGDSIVFRAAPKFEVLAVNALGNELTNSSHAVAAGEVFIRTHQNLWCIAGSGAE